MIHVTTRVLEFIRKHQCDIFFGNMIISFNATAWRLSSGFIVHFYIHPHLCVKDIFNVPEWLIEAVLKWNTWYCIFSHASLDICSLNMHPVHVVCKVWYQFHDDMMTCKHFLHYWPFVRGICQSLVDSPHKRPVMWTGFFFLTASISCWTNSQVDSDFRF